MTQPNRVSGIYASRNNVDFLLPPVIAWDTFRGGFRWSQGEHVALIGPTGAGKSTLAMFLLEYRKYVVAFATKPVDSTLDSLQEKGFRRAKRWKDFRPPNFEPRRLLWPSARELYAEGTQAKEFREAFEHIYREGKWCVFVDELWYIINALGFTKTIKTYLMQARSLKISLMCCTQRPSGVPVELYDQSTHLFFWRDNDERNLSRLGGISWADADTVRMAIANLDKYQVLYVNTRVGLESMVRFTPPGPPSKQRRKAH